MSLKSLANQSPAAPGAADRRSSAAGSSGRASAHACIKWTMRIFLIRMRSRSDSVGAPDADRIRIVGRRGARQAPPIGSVTFPLPPQSGQVSPSTFPLPSHFRQMLSPAPSVPGGTLSGLLSLMASSPSDVPSWCEPAAALDVPAASRGSRTGPGELNIFGGAVRNRRVSATPLLMRRGACRRLIHVIPRDSFIVQ